MRAPILERGRFSGGVSEQYNPVLVGNDPERSGLPQFPRQACNQPGIHPCDRGGIDCSDIGHFGGIAGVRMGSLHPGKIVYT